MVNKLNLLCGVILLSHFGLAVGFDRELALSTSQGAIGKVIANHQLLNTSESPVNLADFRGKPLVISMIYTSCYHICPTTTQHLRKVVNKARAALGTDAFNVLTIGFDTFRDTPQMMRYFADRQRMSEANWHFLSGDKETVDSLAASLGFIYFSTPNGFDHLIQTTLLDDSGTVYRQIYGITFDTPLLVDPLKELVLGHKSEASFLQNFANQIKLFCTVYDPSQDKYRFDYSIIIGTIIGFLCVGLVGFQLIKEWRLSLGRNA